MKIRNHQKGFGFLIPIAILAIVIMMLMAVRDYERSIAVEARTTPTPIAQQR